MLLHLLLLGAKVIMACRDMKKCESARDEIISETFNKKVDCVQCDLASLKSIREFVEHIKESKVTPQDRKSC